MFNWLNNLLGLRKRPCKSYALPHMSKLERRVYTFLRTHRPAKTEELHKALGSHNLGSVINQLRLKGFVIEVEKHKKNTTYLLRNRKCH